eukprot:TRINITY_DN24603_c0_g1_i1.p1 TRINITY_DN24603_c0_g1~~TRINITY_DN24603_c0_g1_i1.p1  ORF type:complete len:197 (+),score=45.67 TRINITY_DN24603_c0_g1_i1:614-1204(+)
MQRFGQRPIPFLSTPKDIEYRQGKYGSDRADYLQQLVTEFQDTEDPVGREQVVANLANFSYDPINFAILRQLRVPELFVDCLSADPALPPAHADLLQEFAAGGLCNLCYDPEIAAIIVASDGIAELIACLGSRTEETVLSAIVTLDALLEPATASAIATSSVIECIQQYTQSSNVRLKNLAIIFLEHLHNPALERR